MNDNFKNSAHQAQESEPTIQKRLPKKILVVDDDPLALSTAEEILRKAGYAVTTLNNPRFIFKVIKAEQPDLILLDIIMRPVDGYALCAQIKNAYADRIAVLLCTALSYEQDLIEKAYKEFGADDYILKPLKPKSEELLEKVKTLLKKTKKISPPGCETKANIEPEPGSCSKGLLDEI